MLVTNHQTVLPQGSFQKPICVTPGNMQLEVAESRLPLVLEMPSSVHAFPSKVKDDYGAVCLWLGCTVYKSLRFKK